MTLPEKICPRFSLELKQFLDHGKDTAENIHLQQHKIIIMCFEVCFLLMGKSNN